MLVIIVILVAGFFTFTFNPQSASAQMGHQHTHEPTEKLGVVNFKVSCNAKAQKQFNTAVAWLHSFEYEEAEKAFVEVSTSDPRCGMAYWGIAMTNYHTIWVPPTPTELQKGWAAAEKAKSISAPTQRERDYIQAIETFYKESDKVDHRTRTFAYHEAMKRLHLSNPADNEASVFYALTLVATGMMLADKTYAREKEAAQILNRVLTVEPQHPGVTHYLIHSYDSPELAELALPAARRYAKLAPASSHALHMPSHIFTRLGLWQEDIESNLAAESAAKAFAVRHHMPGVWDEQLHAMDYLVYAYLQGAQDKHAWAVLDELKKIKSVDPQTFKVAYACAAIPARYALERRAWEEAANLTLPQGGWSAFPWEQFRWAEVHIHFARAIGSAHLGDVKSARREVAILHSIQETLMQENGDYDWAKQSLIAREVASAWVSHAEGNGEEALKVMRAAADLDDATNKHPVTPGAILPAREQLGDLLLELKRPAEALKEFEVSLRSTPNRFNGLYGAARAAEIAGDKKASRAYYTKLVKICQNADTVRPELEKAKAFLDQSSKI